MDATNATPAAEEPVEDPGAARSIARAEAALRESEERLLAASEAARAQLAATLESIGDAFYAVDADFRLTYVNARAESMWGRSQETLIGRHLWSEFPQAVGGEPYARHLAVMRDRRPVHFEAHSPVLGRWMEASIYPDPASGGLACYFRDVTERRAAEAALRTSEAKYRTLFESIDEGFVVLDVIHDSEGRPVDALYLESNPAAAKLTGVPDLAGHRLSEVMPGSLPDALEIYDRVARTGIAERHERYYPPSNRWYDGHISRVANVGATDDARHVAVVFQDITERKRAENALRQSAERQAFLLKFSDALRAAPDEASVATVAIDLIVAQLEVDRCWITVRFPHEDRAVVVHDYRRRPDLVSMRREYRLSDFPVAAWQLEAGTLVLPDIQGDASLTDQDRTAYAALAIGAQIAVRLRKGEGRAIWSLAVADQAPRHWTRQEAELLEEAAERTWAAIERARADAALRESEEKYRSLFEAMHEGFALCEVVRDAERRVVDYRYLELNPALARHGGLSPEALRGRRATEAFPDLDRWLIDTYARVVDERESVLVEHYYPHVDRWLRINAFPRGGDRFAVLYDDITARRRAEDEVRESQKRQAFLLELSDRLRAEPDAGAVADRAIRMLIEQMQLDRSYIVSYRLEDDRADLVHQVGNDTVPPLPDEFILSDYPSAFRTIFDQTLVIDDDLERRGLSDAERRNSGRLGMRATVAASLRKGENRPLWSMVAISSRPRRWTRSEITLVEEVAERTWVAMERARAEAALRESEEKYRTVFESMDEGFLVHEMVRNDAGRVVDYRLLDANPAHQRATGLPRETIGKLGSEFMPHVEQHWLDLFHRVSTSGVAERAEMYNEPTSRWYNVQVSPVSGHDRVAIVFDDVTPRKQAELALKASEARFRTMADLVPDLLWESDASGSTPWYNARWMEYTGQTLEQALGWGWTDAIHPDDRERSAANYARAAARGETLVQEHRIRRNDGVYRWFLIRAEPLRDAEGRVVRWFGAATDMHAQRMALEEAERLAAERTAERDSLRRKLAAAEEAERRRLARELHDQLGQQLTAMSLGLEDARRLVTASNGSASGDGTSLPRRLERLMTLAREMTMGTRYLALELRPPELDDMGLENALETYVAEWRTRFGLAAEVLVTGENGRVLPSDVGSALYRIVQEALTNVAKHARATAVSVIVEKTASEVRLIVEDDGRGFDMVATADRARRELRLGLAGMRERAALLGGDVKVESHPGRGATVFARLPLPTASDAAQQSAAEDGK